MSYSDLGNQPLALEFALRGLSYGEVLFGAYAEETVMVVQQDTFYQTNIFVNHEIRD